MTERKKELIKNLMFLNESVSTQEKYIQKLLEMIKTTVPEAEQISLANISDDLLSEIIPVYDQYFTEIQLEDLNKFFKTDSGVLYHKFMNKMAAEGYKIGEKIGEIISQKIKELKNEKD